MMRNTQPTKASATEQAAMVRCGATGLLMPVWYAIRFVRPYGRGSNRKSVFGSDSSQRNGKDGIKDGVNSDVDLDLRNIDHNLWYPDLKSRLSGQELWIAPSTQALQIAVERGMINPAAFSESSPLGGGQSGGWRALLDNQIRRSIIDGISLARRSGSALAGYFKVRTALNRADRLGMKHFIIFTAISASSAIVAQLKGCKTWYTTADVVAQIADRVKVSPLSRENDVFDPDRSCVPVHVSGLLADNEIGLSFGRPSVVHATVNSFGLYHRLLGDVARLHSLRNM